MFATILRYFWFLLAAMTLWNTHVFAARAQRQSPSSTEDDPTLEVLDSLFTRPLVAICLILGVLQLLARAPTPFHIFCTHPPNPFAVLSIAVLAAWSLGITLYVWQPRNSPRLKLLSRAIGLPPNMLFLRGAVTVSQLGFWAGVLLTPDLCRSLAELHR